MHERTQHIFPTRLNAELLQQDVLQYSTRRSGFGVITWDHNVIGDERRSSEQSGNYAYIFGY